VKTFGIYLCYPPNIDLRAEGLGRHLGEFLKGTDGRSDVKFVVACPSWLTGNLKQLLESFGLASDAIEIIAPAAPPLLFAMLNRLNAKKKRQSMTQPRLAKLRRLFLRGGIRIERHVASARSIVSGAFWASMMLIFLLPAAVTRSVWGRPRYVRRLAGRIVRKTFGGLRRIGGAGGEPAQPDESLKARLHRTMEENESALLGRLIGARKDISAWYSPTAFWPTFNDIRAPRLMCVPDVVLNEFPTGFSQLGGARLEKDFNKLETAIYQGEYFVTYSERVKWDTLVRSYGADPDSVYVVRHGANRLDDLIRVTGFPDSAAATYALCCRLWASSLNKDLHRAYDGLKMNPEMRFIFYASQFRPNKNIITLLRAYEYLLRRRYVGHKLVLTGYPLESDDISKFIIDRNLVNDVLCLRNLSEQELAACYHLADLAVNPSLSEGGCPFTFTEAMSVGTPVVMARIPVTEEVITDPTLQAAMLFDPFDWREMASRIEYGLNNRDSLRALEQPFYDRLAQRTWRDVVDDYVAILDRISTREEPVHE
jgi:glycosyltransferase involved in cell wall biosynthesis